MPNAPLSEPTLVNDEVHNWYKLEMSRLAKTPPRAPVRRHSSIGSPSIVLDGSCLIQAEVLKDAWAHRTCESHLPSRELHTLILSEKTYPTTLDADYNYKVQLQHVSHSTVQFARHALFTATEVRAHYLVRAR